MLKLPQVSLTSITICFVFGSLNAIILLAFTHFADTLCDALPHEVRKGAFEAGQSAHFNGKIQYKQCRKPVYTPSDWDPALAERSAELPDARLILDFVYGYQGRGGSVPWEVVWWEVLAEGQRASARPALFMIDDKYETRDTHGSPETILN